MKIKLFIALVGLCFGLSSNCYAQIDKSRFYLGVLGNTSVVFSTDAEATKLNLIFFSNPLDTGEGVIGPNNTGIFTSALGRQVSFSVTDSAVTGTISGQAFSIQRESDLGSQSGLSGVYSGVLQDRQRVATSTYSLDIYFFSSGRILMGAINSGGKIYGTGVRSANGATVVNLNTGVTFRFDFGAGNGSSSGSIATSGLGTTSDFFYIVTRAKDSTLVNVATRGTVAPGQPMIAGFVINDGPKLVMIRAVGPTLGGFGVPTANADPLLTLYRGQTVLLTNDNWSTNANAADIVTAAGQSGAFSLQAGSKDAVLLVRLQPGAYTAQASSVGSASGDVIIEVYEITK